MTTITDSNQPAPRPLLALEQMETGGLDRHQQWKTLLLEIDEHDQEAQEEQGAMISTLLDGYTRVLESEISMLRQEISKMRAQPQPKRTLLKNNVKSGMSELEQEIFGVRAAHNERKLHNEILREEITQMQAAQEESCTRKKKSARELIGKETTASEKATLPSKKLASIRQNHLQDVSIVEACQARLAQDHPRTPFSPCA